MTPGSAVRVELRLRPARTAELRPLTAEDELFLAEEGASLSPAARTTALLARCLVALGGAPASQEAVRSLAIGDRDALVLHLRRLTLGERLACVFSCPACDEKMDLDLLVSDLLVHPGGSTDQGFEIARTGRRRTLRFRLPNGGDQEALVDLARRDVDRAALELLRRCLQGRAQLNAGEAERAASEMARLDPQAEILLDLRCPACGAGAVVPFDPARHLFAELCSGVDDLYREVHLLALHYHWPESELLAMPRRRRHRYLALLAEAGEAPGP